MSSRRRFLTAALALAAGHSSVASDDLPILLNERGTFAYGFAIEGDNLYSASGWDGVIIRDADDPTGPIRGVVRSSFGPLAHDMAVQDEILYVVTNGEGLATWDVSDPVSPQRLGTAGPPASWQFVEVDGDLAVAGSRLGVYLYDVSVPSAPTLVGDIPRGVRGFQIHDGLLYMATGIGQKGGPWIYDVSDPAAPALVADIGFASGGTLGGTDILVANAPDGIRVAYISDPADLLWAVDVSEPAKPVVRGSLAIPGSGAGGFMSLKDDVMFLGRRSGDLMTIDVSRPFAPALLGTTPMPEVQWQHGPHARIGDRVFAASFPIGLEVSLADPAAPVVTTRIDEDLPIQAGLAVRADDVVYVNDGNGKTSVYCLKDPQQPALVGSETLARGPRGLFVDGDVMYRIVQAEFQTVDISDRLDPTVIATLELPLIGGPMAMIDDVIWSVSFFGTSAIDVTDPSSPSTVYSAEDPPRYRSATTLDGWLLATEDDRVRVLDVSDPSSPTVAASWPPQPGVVLDVQVIDGIAWALSTETLRSYDVSNPLAPVILGELTEDPETALMLISCDRIILGRAETLAIVDITDPARPVMERSIPLPPTPDPAFSVRGFAAVDDALLIARDVHGVVVADAASLLDCCPADLDEDGLIGLTDLLVVLASWGPAEPGAPADLDGSGVVDFEDLLAVLTRWGPCR